MYNEYFDKLCALLALEYNCEPGDFLKSDNLLTTSALKEGSRNYSGKKPFLSITTLGKNTVMTADEVLHPFLQGLMERIEGHWLFNIEGLSAINGELSKYGYELAATHHLCLPFRDVQPQKDYPVNWYYEREIDRFYGDPRFKNALCEKYLPQRPDRIAVTALDGDRIMGMAGCSEDAPGWLQIGVDVCEGYRGRGVGTYLVTLLRNEILARGMIPFYGSVLSNIGSQKIAANSGFRLTWVETYAIDKRV